MRVSIHGILYGMCVWYAMVWYVCVCIYVRMRVPIHGIYVCIHGMVGRYVYVWCVCMVYVCYGMYGCMYTRQYTYASAYASTTL